MRAWLKRMLRRGGKPVVPFMAPPCPPRPLAQTGAVEIALPSTVDTGNFARFVPFGDGREVIVRRGRETGFHYGFEQSRRRVKLVGGEFDLIKYEGMISPPIMMAGQSPGGDDDYHPVSDVLYVPGVEALIPRRPVRRGFTDDEVERILAAIRVVTL